MLLTSSLCIYKKSCTICGYQWFPTDGPQRAKYCTQNKKNKNTTRNKNTTIKALIKLMSQLISIIQNHNFYENEPHDYIYISLLCETT